MSKTWFSNAQMDFRDFLLYTKTHGHDLIVPIDDGQDNFV